MKFILASPAPIDGTVNPRQYYEWWRVGGLVLTSDPSKAYRFSTEEKARNVLGGDERLKGWVVLRVDV